MYHPRETQEELQQAKTILVVEDDASVGASLVQAIVEETPYLAFLVVDALQALQVMRDLKPDMLLLDYQLPHMNGFELYDRMQEQRVLSDIPILFISANLPQEEIERRHLIGMRKPFKLDDLLSTIKKVLSSPEKYVVKRGK
ncbi:MAG: hypothetical protein NVS2B12_14200 [Ktedonobacteraceae bacterium]